MNRWFVSAVIFLLANTSTTFAQENPQESAEAITLKQLIDEALQKSPAIQTSRRRYEAARGRVVAAWLPDDPMIGADVEGQSEILKLDRINNEYMLQQTVPFPTTLWLRGRAAAEEARKAYQEYQEKARDVIWHLEQPYYEWFLAKHTLAALEEIQTLADRLSKTVQARYESNQAAQQDVLKARIESSKIGLEKTQQREKAHLAEAHLSHLLGRPLMTQYALTEPLRSRGISWTVEQLESHALENRPELKALAIGVRRAKTQKWLEQTQWLPEVTGRIEARQFKGEGSIREYDTFIGLTVPVWSIMKGLSGEWKSAGKDVEATEADYEAIKNEVLLAVHEAFSKIKVAEQGILSYETLILPQAKQQTEVALAAYEAGRADVLSLVDAQRMLREAQIAYFEYLAQLEMGLSNLRFAVGGELPSASPVPGGSS